MPKVAKSRRLKHYKNQFSFLLIGMKARSDLEIKLSATIDEFIDISHKYKLLDHTKEKDIKLIDKKIQVDKIDGGYQVNLQLHIHHYSKITFDYNSYLLKLNEIFELYPSAVKHKEVSKKAPKKEEEKKEVDKKEVDKKDTNLWFMNDYNQIKNTSVFI